MSEIGWEVHIVSSPGADFASFPYASIHEIEMQREVSLGADAAALVAFIKLIRRIRPTIVSVGTPKAGLLGILAAWFARVPFRVYVLRGLRLETLAGFARLLSQAIESFVGVISTHVLAVSPSLATAYAELPGVSREKVRVLGHGASKGVDLRKFTPFSGTDSELAELREDLSLESEIPVVGYVGRISRDKGAYLLRESSNAIYSAGLDHQILMVGRNELDEETQDFTAGFVAPVICVDHTEDVERLYWAFDCFCLPTLREGFPNVVLEAAASGIPVVVSDATGACDTATDQVTGLVAKKGDVVSLAEKLRLVLQGDVDTKTIARNARQNVEEKYTLEIVTGNHVAFYNSLMARPSKHRTQFG